MGSKYSRCCSLKRKCNAIQSYIGEQLQTLGTWSRVAATVASAVSLGLFGEGALQQKSLMKYLTPVLELIATQKVNSQPSGAVNIT